MSVRFDFKPVYGLFNDIEKRQLPYAHSLALTNTAMFARRAMLDEFKRQFDRPKPSTLNEKSGPIRVKSASVSKYPNDYSEIRVKDQKQVKGDAALVYLSHQIHGGRRAEKRSEGLLRRAGVLLPGYYMVAGEGAVYDAYGNISPGQMQQILSAVGAQRDALANFKGRTLKDAYRNQRRMRAKTASYFVAYRGRSKTKHLAEGVWQRYGKSEWEVRPVLIFVKGAPRYRRRIRWNEIALGVGRLRFPIEFHNAMKYALARAKVQPSSLVEGFTQGLSNAYRPFARQLDRIRTS